MVFLVLVIFHKQKGEAKFVLFRLVRLSFLARGIDLGGKRHIIAFRR